jgi:alkyldihydroxyacetonephosphate synthase
MKGDGNRTLTRRLREAIGRAEAVVDARSQLDEYTADTYWPALEAQARGAPLGRPDVAVLAKNEVEVAATLRVANESGTPVVTRGGGSGSQGGAVPIHGGILLDMTGLDAVIEIDEISLTVTVEAGMNGKELEEHLNRHGLTLPHYPASVAWATVGGYVAARGSGVLSTRYGKIEDLLLSLRVVTPGGGVIDTVKVPRHAVGPELTQLYVGSEGTFGVITRAVLRVIPLPEDRRFELVSFPNLADGVDAMRLTIADGVRPSVIRLYDEHASRTSLGPVVGADLDGSCAVLAFEGRKAVVDAEAEVTLGLVNEHGGVLLDGSLSETWWDRRYDFYEPPHHPVLPAIWGTIEAVATYARIMDVYQAMNESLVEAFGPQGLKLKAHMSHWYPWGTMIYGRFVVPEPGPNSVELHDTIWRAGVEAILGAGGVMNDHHGVGIKLAPFMEAQHGAAMEVLRSIKRALDPNGIMNPGKTGF